MTLPRPAPAPPGAAGVVAFALSLLAAVAAAAAGLASGERGSIGDWFPRAVTASLVVTALGFGLGLLFVGRLDQRSPAWLGGLRPPRGVVVVVAAGYVAPLVGAWPLEGVAGWTATVLAAAAVAVGSAGTLLGLRLHQRAAARRVAVYLLTLTGLVAVGVRVDWGTLQESFFDPEIFADLFPEIITQAARNTLIFTFFGFTGGLLLGLLLALMRLSSIRLYRMAATAFVEIFRGLPALITIILVGYVLPIALQVRVPFTYGPGSLALAIVAGAYLAETIRAGIEAVPKGQMEAARSLGMSRSRAMTFIIIPQAFRIILPPLTNELVLLIKDTSLLYVLGTTDDTIELAKYGRDAVSDTFNGTPLVAVALMYLAITLPLTQVAAHLERRARRAR